MLKCCYYFTTRPLHGNFFSQNGCRHLVWIASWPTLNHLFVYRFFSILNRHNVAWCVLSTYWYCYEDVCLAVRRSVLGWQLQHARALTDASSARRSSRTGDDGQGRQSEGQRTTRTDAPIAIRAAGSCSQFTLQSVNQSERAQRHWSVNWGLRKHEREPDWCSIDLTRTRI